MSKHETDELVGDYKYGFKTDAKTVISSGKGLSREVVEFISKAKNEPMWMKEFRLKSYDSFLKQSNPSWGPDLSGIDFNEYTYYIKSSEKTENNWDSVPTEIKDTFEKLGIPEAEAKYLAGSSTQFESEVVYHNNLKELDDLGVIF
ncbi:MAG: Fe-S cluster assembly protein SufB, partial [Anaeroplasmataceae bacterium]|nr:Fe-S cluster assembly protein SufB [Anaeroplasmataceae bacterium]